MTMTLGRMSIFNPETIELNGRQLSVSGDYTSATSLADTLAVRDDIASLSGQLIAMTWDDDPTLDGYYLVGDAEAEIATLNDNGFIVWGVAMVLIGSSHDVDLQSRITGTVIDNDFSVTEGGSEPFHAPSRNHIAYDTGATVPSNITRTGADGAMTIWRDVDFAVDPKWTVDPTDYYSGAATITLNSLERTSLVVPDNLTNTQWQIDNSLARVSGNGTNGRFDVEHHDGSSWETAKVWEVRVGGMEAGEWDKINIIRNTPEETIIRLIRTVAAGGRYTLDLTLRRGSRFVQGYLSVASASTIRVGINGGEAGTNIGNQSIRATADDGDGNRYVIGTAHTATRVPASGYIELASTTTFDFYIGSEIAGTSAITGDQAAQLELQYYGNIVETTEALTR